MKIKMQIPDWSILLAVASTTLYLVFRNLGREAGSFAFLWAPIALLSIIYIRPTSYIKGPIKILFIYGLIMVGVLQYTLWINMNKWNKDLILYEFYFLVVMTTILTYYREIHNFRKLALISKWAFIFIIISLITTNIALFIDPELVRMSASTGKFTESQSGVFKYTGAMGYSYLQGIVCLTPIIIYHIKKKREMVFSPKILIAILILLIITEIRAHVFANLLVTVLITILSFLESKKRHSFLIIFSLIGILMVTIPSSFFANIFISMSSYFDKGSVMNGKLSDFAMFINNPVFDTSTDAGGRAERYPILYKALKANPIWGYASSDSLKNISAGGHLYWMNRLTQWGIPCFLFFVFVLYKIYRSISSLFDADFRFYYFLSVMGLIILGLLKVVGGREPWLILIVVIPGLYFLPLLHQTKRIKTIQKTKLNK